MDISIHDLESLTADEINSILALNDLRAEAISDSSLIRSEISFKIGEKIKTFWHDSHNAEYITHDGVWQARYLHQAYDVDCSVEGIYSAYKQAYLNPNKTCAARYFRSFVAKLRKERP